MFLNRQLGSESAKSRVGKGRVLLGRVGLGLGRIGVGNADSDGGFSLIFSNRQPATSCRLPIQTLVFESATESATRI